MNKTRYRSCRNGIADERLGWRRSSILVMPSQKGAGRFDRQPQILMQQRQSQAAEVASRIARMADDEVRGRYHELVDKGLDQQLTALERFEMERIEVRLDSDDLDPVLAAENRTWDIQREQLIDGIENLLQKLKN